MATADHFFHPPAMTEYFEYYGNYVRQVPEGDVRQHGARQIQELQDFFAKVSEDESMKTHPPYTWTFKQVVGHLIDAERIFAERLHRFSAGDLTPLPSMDQNPYVTNQDFETPSLRDLVEELLACRRANVLMIQRIKPSAWDNRGMASDHPITVRALIYILVGHINHHLSILRGRIGM